MFKWMAGAAVILTWPLISFGAFVRLHGAGLACPDWPLCYGQILPPPGFEIAMEVGHRFIATLLGLLIIGMVVVTYRSTSARPYRLLSWWTLVLILIQGILGGLTVLMKLWPPTVSLHLIGGNLLLAILVYQTTWAFLPPRESVLPARPWPPVTKLLAWETLGLFIIIFSGGLNSSTYSGYACTAFPGCHEGPWSFGLSGQNVGEQALPNLPPELQGNFLPQFQNEWIHMLHRLIAIVGGLGLMHAAAKYFLRSAPLRKAGWAVLVLVPLQWGVGVLNAIYQVPIPISGLHTAIAATLVGLFAYAFARSSYDIR